MIKLQEFSHGKVCLHEFLECDWVRSNRAREVEVALDLLLHPAIQAVYAPWGVKHDGPYDGCNRLGFVVGGAIRIVIGQRGRSRRGRLNQTRSENANYSLQPHFITYQLSIFGGAKLLMSDFVYHNLPAGHALDSLRELARRDELSDRMNGPSTIL